MRSLAQLSPKGSLAVEMIIFLFFFSLFSPFLRKFDGASANNSRVACPIYENELYEGPLAEEREMTTNDDDESEWNEKHFILLFYCSSCRTVDLVVDRQTIDVDEMWNCTVGKMHTIG